MLHVPVILFYVIHRFCFKQCDFADSCYCQKMNFLLNLLFMSIYNQKFRLQMALHSTEDLLKPIVGHVCVFCYLFQASHEEVHNHTMYAITHLE